MSEGVRRQLKALRIVLVTGMICVMAVVAVGGTTAAARDTGVGGGGVSPGVAGTPIGTRAVPTTFANVDIRGGYVAAGVGLRNRGAGTIALSGIPAGATVHSAYLFWSVLGGAAEPANFKNGRFKGSAITGLRVGSGGSPCWNSVTTGYAYRANVTSLVTGNGNYALSGFASGVATGADPFSTAEIPPLAEGASLVVLYSKASYPLTRVTISNGYGLVSTATGLTTTMPFGFAATNPVGQVRTTFIGADGQRNFAEPASTINGVGVSQADWDGTDRPVPAYSQGNLWDTDTVNTVNLVKPGNTSATVKVAGGPDCLVWVAQVLSIGRNGAADTDGDKLLDGWEANGYDANNDGIIDVNLPSFGSSVVRKDLYVEMDYMGAEATCPCHLPLAADLNRIRAVYASAPFANNPSGQAGINLHLDAGAARGAAFNLGGGNLVAHDADLNPVVAQFSAIKSANFRANRAKIFYYMIWAHGYDGGTSSGNAFAIPNDSFVVTLGAFPSHGTSDQKVGTFVHEFGHDLGLAHGGNTGDNYKPNYLSVMNYAFQFTGVPRTGTLAPNFGYSSATLPSLNEFSLNESVGLNSTAASTYRTRWFCPNNVQRTSPGTANGPIDWNCNGVASGTVAADINGPTDNFGSTLTGFNDWANLVYGGGTVGAGAAPITAQQNRVLPDELTWDQAEKFAH
jgi:hypothetical protein